MFSMAPLLFVSLLVLAASSIDGTLAPLGLIILAATIGMLMHALTNLLNYPSIIIDASKVQKVVEARYTANKEEYDVFMGGKPDLESDEDESLWGSVLTGDQRGARRQRTAVGRSPSKMLDSPEDSFGEDSQAYKDSVPDGAATARTVGQDGESKVHDANNTIVTDGDAKKPGSPSPQKIDEDAFKTIDPKGEEVELIDLDKSIP
jgi:hypothetical protein